MPARSSRAWPVRGPHQPVPAGEKSLRSCPRVDPSQRSPPSRTCLEENRDGRRSKKTRRARARAPPKVQGITDGGYTATVLATLGGDVPRASGRARAIAVLGVVV